ncbi:hypothetical protein SAMN06264346_101552 [Chryseobacterium profundimaris]|uniref:Uncharacterized protein n=1 Tax=Chryseobacterium profundimaris TaxID=1387275 RepID=A0ABY1NCS7_9FLAO|nr:hypothetical protein SAMN06264346_101552 [Chryseobacterium profundimaris]
MLRICRKNAVKKVLQNPAAKSRSLRILKKITIVNKKNLRVMTIAAPIAHHVTVL